MRNTFFFFVDNDFVFGLVFLMPRFIVRKFNVQSNVIEKKKNPFFSSLGGWRCFFVFPSYIGTRVVVEMSLERHNLIPKFRRTVQYRNQRSRKSPKGFHRYQHVIIQRFIGITRFFSRCVPYRNYGIPSHTGTDSNTEAGRKRVKRQVNSFFLTIKLNIFYFQPDTKFAIHTL